MADLPKYIATAPEHVYLNLGDFNLGDGEEDEEFDDFDFAECSEVTWSADPATLVSVSYVRADLHDALRAEIAALQARLAELEPGEGEFEWVDEQFGRSTCNKRVAAWRPGGMYTNAVVYLDSSVFVPADALRMAKALVAAAREAEAMNREVGK